jgi:hypothetical protein
MSFLYQNSKNQGTDGRVIFAQRKCCHDVQNYNELSFIRKVEANKLLKAELNKKYSQVNGEVHDSLEMELRAKRKEKAIQQ